MSIFNRHPQDHVGIWFEQRRKLGINDTICWARYTPKWGLLKMHKFQHGNGDGMSVILHMLNEAGHGDTLIPTSRESCVPSKKELKRIQKNNKPYPKNIKWRYWNPDIRQTKSTFNTLFFSKEETKLIEDNAMSLNVPLTTLALWSLNKAVSRHLLEPEQAYTWFYPVNLRGAVDYGTKYANYSSGFYLPVTGNIDIQTLHQQIRHKLKSGEHWLSWQQAKISKYLPRFVIRYLYQYLSKKQFYAGSFSAMGTWSKEAIPTSDMTSKMASDIALETSLTSTTKVQEDLSQERWFGCPPGTKNYPISNCVINWNGQLSLTLKLHPSIGDDSVGVTTLYDWGQGLLSEQDTTVNVRSNRERILSYSYDDAVPNNNSKKNRR
jgi:hypothetical protein